MPTCPQETIPRGPKTAPKGPQTLPRGPKIALRGSQDPPKRPSERPRASQDPPKRPQEYTQRPYEVASLLLVLCCSSRLNHIQFIIQLCIGSSQETIKNIQELSKTNTLEPPSFQASLPLSLQVPAAKRLGGIREAQTIYDMFGFQKHTISEPWAGVKQNPKHYIRPLWGNNYPYSRVL